MRLDMQKEWKLNNERYAFTLLNVLSGLALFLTAFGLHSVMSYGVQQRHREFGLRMALGAEARQIMRSVLRRGLVLGLCGVAVGLLAGWWLSRYLEQLLFEVSPHDPLVFIAVGLILSLAAVAASTLPALRALRINPMEALRSE